MLLVGCVPTSVTVVKLPVLGVTDPIDMLSIVPTAVGLITTVPVPVGLNVTVPLLGLKFTLVVTFNVVNVAGCGTILPIVKLSIVPTELGFNVKLLVTVKLATVMVLLLRFNVRVLLLGLVVATIAPAPTMFNVPLVGLRVINPCPDTDT